MKCKSCGAEIRDESKFCPFCGKAVVESAEPLNDSNKGNPNRQQVLFNETSNNNGTKANLFLKKISLTGKQLGIIGAVAIILLAIVYIVGHNTTVNLNKYVNITYDGYNTVGRANLDFNSDKFVDDYKGKIKFDEKKLLKRQ